jgi:hypothetical protein
MISERLHRRYSRNSGSSLGIRFVPGSRSLCGKIALVATGVSSDCQKVVISVGSSPRGPRSTSLLGHDVQGRGCSASFHRSGSLSAGDYSVGLVKSLFRQRYKSAPVTGRPNVLR